LAKQADDICGRDIKNAVVEAAARANMEGRAQVELYDLVAAIKRIKSSRVSPQGERGQILARSEHNKLVVEQIQHLFSPKQSGQATSAQSSTRPLSDLFEQPALAIPVQPLILSVSDTPEQLAQPSILPLNGTAEQPVLATLAQPSILLQSDTFEESEMDTPTQPLVRIRSDTFEQPEEMRS
jgi:hypothetical protein